MIEKLLKEQKENLDYFYEQIDHSSLQTAFDYLLSCKGVLFLTGVGKSGFVAQKVAATMMSTGTKAFFLSPIDALHGDLGMMSREDKVIIFSKSGQTEELMHLLPFLRSKQTSVVAFTSNERSFLARAVDIHVNLPCIKELCPFDLAPTTSTEIQLLVGDLLSIYLMEKKQFGLAEYAQNHPAGSIGKRATIRVKDLMKSKEQTPICVADVSLAEVLHVFTEKRCGCLLVVDQERRLKGIFTDGDLTRALQAKGEGVLQERLAVLMNKSPRSIHTEALALDAMKLMESDQKYPITVLPVVEKEEVVGIIKMHDILQSGI